MRNLKRALSLTLASVMLLGMMVLGTSAAGYPDVDDNDNVEAIEVLQAIGVMSGSNSGNFNPDSKVSRIEMAIVMANLLDLDVDYFQGQNTFSDVPDWASGYVNACAASGIVTGVGGGRFGTGNVTATQAALMMMKALGYFQYNSDFGSDWARATALQAAKINLFDGLKVQDNTQLTRNQVAQLALNTLQATMVDADDNTLSITTPDGVTVAGGNVKYVVRASNDTKISGSINRTEVSGSSTSGINGWTIELGEQLYSGDLKRVDGTDDFGRPANVWSYKSNEIGSYANDITFSYTAAVSERDLYNDIGKNALDNYRWSVYVDGTGVSTAKPDRNKSDDWGASAKGVLTQVFVSAKDNRVTVTCIHSYAGEITRVVDNGDTATVTIRQYAPSAKNDDSTLKYSNPQAGNRTYETTNGTFAVGDIVIYTAANNEVQSVVKATPVEGTVAAYKAGSNAKLDDKTYSYAKMIASNLEDSNEDNPSLNDKYIFYVDANDYLIAFKGIDTIDEYLYVVRAQNSVTGVDAKVVLSDGSEKVVKIDEVKGTDSSKADATTTGSYGAKGVVTVGNVYSYEVSDDVYTLTALKTAGSGAGGAIVEGDYTKPITVDATPSLSAITTNKYTSQGPTDDPYGYSGIWYQIKRDSAKMAGKNANDSTASPPITGNTSPADVTVTNNTVFVDVKDNLVYTGYRAVVDYDKANAAVVYDKNGRAEIIFITDNKSSGVEAEFFFLKSGKPVNTKTGTTAFYTYEAWIDGEKTEVTTKGNLSNNANGTLVSNALYKIEKKNSSNEVTQIKQVGSAWTNTGILATNCATVKDGYALTLKATSSNLVGGAAVNKTTFRYNDDTIFVVIEPKNGKGTTLDALNVYRGADTDIVVEDTGDNSNRTAVYVIDAGDKSEDTPMAKLVYIYKPAAVGSTASTGSANDSFSSSKDGTYYIYSVADPAKMPTGNTVRDKALSELDLIYDTSRGDSFRYNRTTGLYELVVNGNLYEILVETGSKQVASQPTTTDKVTEILNDKDEDFVDLAPLVSTNIRQSVETGTDGKTNITLSGTMTKVTTGAGGSTSQEQKDAFAAFGGGANQDVSDFERLFDLKPNTWGFVVVQTGDSVWELLVGQRAEPAGHMDATKGYGGTKGIIVRCNSGENNGLVKFVDTFAVTVDGVDYVIDASALR